MCSAGPEVCGVSFRAYLRDHDVPCPRCGYNLRGLREPTCPECGQAAGWGAFRSRGPDPKLVHLTGIGVLGSVGLSSYLLPVALTRALERSEAGQMLAAAVIPAVSAVVLILWAACRRRFAVLPAYRQARWCSASLGGLTLAVLWAAGTGAI